MSSISRQGRVAIVAGGSRGIGAEIARQLARDGLLVVVNYVSDAAAAKQLVNEINEIDDVARAAGQGKLAATSVRADISRSDDARRLFDEAERTYGDADVLVVSAGVQAGRRLALGETDDETFEAVVGVNLRGTFYLLREAANRLRRGGSIVTFSSSAVALDVPGQAVYNACKAGVEVMTTLLAKELRGRDITVNAVAPGPTETQLFLRGKSKEAIDRLAEQVPLGRIGRPADIASLVAFLVGHRGRWVNGQTIRANGGLV